MIILGVDPGTRVTGYGLIHHQASSLQVLDYGCIRPPATLESHDRILIIFQGIESLIDKFSPDALSIETQFVHKNAQSALKLGMARGVITLAARRRGIPVFEYTPSKVKLSVTGSGRASKSQVQGMIQRLLFLPVPPEPEDAADALALAICHTHTLSNRLPALAHIG